MKKTSVILIAFLVLAICLPYFGCGASASVGLEFDLSGDTAILVGIGSCKDVDIVIPDVVDGKTVAKIDDYAFSKTDIKSVVIPKNVKEIGNRAFSECASLKEITILSGVTYGENVYLGSGVKKVIVENGVQEIAKNLLVGTASLQEIVFSESVVKICDGAFSYSGIKSITIPSSVTEIGNDAFKGSKVEIAIIPTSVTKMGKNVFDGCVNINFVTLKANEKPSGWDNGWSDGLEGEIIWGGHVHDYQVLSEKAPTCIAGGNVVYKCAECNKEHKVFLPLDDDGHVTENNEWQTDSSTHKQMCKYCRQTYNYGYHEIVDGKCTVCGSLG